MAIIATDNAPERTPIPAGSYVARCYQMIELGTIKELIQGQEKVMHKIRIGWELPTELKVFKEEKGEQPQVISKEFNLTMNEKSTLRAFLKNWRGKDFGEAEIKGFDVTKLLGKSCLLNIVHNTSKANGKTYAEIGSISPLAKGMECPPAINDPVLLSFDGFDYDVYDALPDFIKDKIRKSAEYLKLSAHDSSK